VDSSTGSQAAGLNVVGATAAGTVAVAVISSGAAANLTVNALGTGTIGIGSVSTGAVTITATPTAGNSINWYSASTGGTLLQYNNTSYTTPSISVNGTYYALDSNTTTGCKSASRTAVNVTVKAVPSSVVASANIVTFCGSGTIDLSGIATGEVSDTIAYQNFESSGSTVTYTASGGATKTGSSGGSDRPSNTSFVNSGSTSYWVNNGTATITTNNISSLSNNIYTYAAIL
jgi:hypothetical protein